MCTAGSAISFIVHDKNSAYILITLFIFTCTTITLCLVFIPKVIFQKFILKNNDFLNNKKKIIQVKKDPIGKKKQRPKIIRRANEYRQRSMKYINTEELDDKINQLVQDNRAKEAILEQIDSKIEVLLTKAKILGSECINECLNFISIDDLEFKKLIEKLNIQINQEPREKDLSLLKIKRETGNDGIENDHSVNNMLE